MSFKASIIMYFNTFLPNFNKEHYIQYRDEFKTSGYKYCVMYWYSSLSLCIFSIKTMLYVMRHKYKSYRISTKVISEHNSIYNVNKLSIKFAQFTIQ